MSLYFLYSEAMIGADDAVNVTVLVSPFMTKLLPFLDNVMGPSVANMKINCSVNSETTLS